MKVFVKLFDDRLEVESPRDFPPLVTPKNTYGVYKPRNPYLMDALRYFDYVKCAHEGTRRIRDTMTQVSLPEPEFRQVESAATPLVRVVLQNNVRQRRVWVDSGIISIVGDAVMKAMKEDEKRLLNFTAEYGEISASDAQQLTRRSWASAKRLLQNFVEKGILEYHSRRDIVRDPPKKTPSKGRRSCLGNVKNLRLRKATFETTHPPQPVHRRSRAPACRVWPGKAHCPQRRPRLCSRVHRQQRRPACESRNSYRH